MKIQRFLIALFWLALLSVTISAQTQPVIRPLSVGQPIERELKGDEAHSYSIAVTAGQYLHVVVDQRGIDVVVTLFGVDSKKLAEVDSPNGTQGPEPISMIIETTGNYRLEVRSPEKSAPAGRYEAKIVELRTATEKDKGQIAAQKAFAEGEFLKSQGTAESLRGAIKKYQEALSLYQAVSDKSGEAETLNNIGRVHSDLGEKQEALDSYAKALSLFESIDSKIDQALVLNNIGRIQDDLGEKQKALNSYTQALLLIRLVGDKEGEAVTLNNIAGLYFTLGEKQKALDNYSQALSLNRLVGNKGYEGATLNNIGNVYMSLGDKQKALDYFKQALPIRQLVGDKRNEAVTLNNIAAVYSNLGEKQKALDNYLQVLPLRRLTGDREGEAATLNNIGKVYNDLGEKQKALDYLGQALLLFRLIGYKQNEGRTLNNIGEVYNDLGEKRKAIDYYIQALPIFRFVGDKQSEAILSGNISRIMLSLENPRFSIFYGKQSVNNYQILRSNVQGLNKDVQKTFLKSIDGVYRRLADALLSQQRFAEAQQVLNAFKDQQYFDFNSNLQAAPLTLTMRENELVTTFNQKLERLVAVIRQLDDYKRIIGRRVPNKSEAEQIQIYEADLKAANDDYLAFFKQAETDFSQPISDKDKVGEILDTKEMQTALRNLQSQTGQKAVVIYTLEAEENYRGLLITPDKIVAVSYPIKVAELRQKAGKFFGQLSEVNKQTNAPKLPESEVQKTGKELYSIVFTPIDVRLKELGIKPDVLMWSLDGALRYLPVAALYDGKQYLAERYRNVVFTRANSERMLAPVSPMWTGSGFYNSKEYSLPVRNADDGTMKLIGFDGLKNAKTEVETIFGTKQTRGILGGDLLFNEQFTKESLLKALKLNRPLVHIASHFKFEAGDASSSFLLLGDGKKLTLEDIKNAPDDLFKGVELLTLSACETGVQKERESDGREIDSFAELAQRKGAKAVMASLWRVDDESTARLMMEFYLTRQTNKLTKVEALQKAQLSLIKSKDYSHPYYWSPFILIGNWR